MDRAKIARAILLAAVTLLTMAGCGGSDGIDGTGVAQVELGGTAAVGAPIVNATVTVKASNGTKKSSQTGQDGKFKTDISGLSGPFLMKVGQANGTALFSIASGGGTANIHPFTDLIVRNWFKVQGLDVESEFNSDTAAAQLPNVAQINEIKEAIKKIIALALIKYSLPADLDLMSSAFDANGQGFDNFLDHADVVIINNNITIIVNDPDTQFDGEIVKDAALNTNFAQSDALAPATPAGLRVVPASGTEMIVVWNPTSDNVAVAGYNVYRSDQPSPTKTPFPVFSDSGLTASTQYCYQVEAFDAANNVSAKTAEVCATTLTLGVTDSTPPAAPTGLQATSAGSGAITLVWTAPPDADVASYEIYRGTSGNVTTKIASVVATSYSNINLASASEYCYQVYAFDAAGNKSVAGSNQACGVTGTQPSQVPPSGARSLEFSSVVYGASEADATVLITVNRSGDTSEAVSVSYQLDSGTATAPADFVAASGTLSWPANDTAAKTFLVQIKGDNVAEGNETVQLSLLNPSANAALGGNSSATLNIGNSACNSVLPSAITTNTRISNSCIVVATDVHVSNNATLTIDPGVTLVFQNSAGLYIEQSGALTANGTLTKPILFTAENQTKGWWRGVLFYQSTNNNNQMSYVTVEYGGSRNQYGAAISAVGFTQQVVLTITNSKMTDSSSYGIYLNGDANVTFANNVVTRNNLAAAYTSFNLAGLLDGNSKYSGNVVDVITVDSGAGNSLSKPQIWTVIDADYLMGGANYFYVDAALTILPGARLVFESGRGMSINPSGSLNAVGTTEKPIVFTGKSPTPGFWQGILFDRSNNVANRLEHVVVEYGGSRVQYPANVSAVGFGQATPTLLTVINSRLSDSSTYGFNFEGPFAKVAFSSNVVTRNQVGAGYLDMGIAGLVDAASSYSGNIRDEVIVNFNNAISTPQTWPGINAKYVMRGNNEHVVAAGGHLTIQAGATLVFEAGCGLTINNGGALTAQGTSTNPITFTASSLTAGHWRGIFFSESNDSANVLDYVTVEYGGGTRQFPGNISITGITNPARLSVTNSVIRQSLTNGILIQGANVNINAVQSTEANNTFSDNAAAVTTQ